MMLVEVWWRGKLYWKSPPLPYVSVSTLTDGIALTLSDGFPVAVSRTL